VRSILFTSGVVVTASDGEILEAKAVIDRAGVGCEPASAASVAGIKRLAASGLIEPGARVVAVLTGHMLKDPDALVSGGQLKKSVKEIDPSLTALAKAVKKAGAR
jgi:threonine synthase